MMLRCREHESLFRVSNDALENVQQRTILVRRAHEKVCRVEQWRKSRFCIEPNEFRFT